jgi:hypothetical protein
MVRTVMTLYLGLDFGISNLHLTGTREVPSDTQAWKMCQLYIYSYLPGYVNIAICIFGNNMIVISYGPQVT